MLSSIDQQDTTTAGYHRATNAASAISDARARSAKALDDHWDFFTSPDHMQKVAKVESIVQEFFTRYKAIYVNRRSNRGCPMTVVKIEQPDFPNHLSSTEKQTRFHAPLAKLGVEVVFSKNTNSYLFRIK
jgi:hypothetical protein